MQLRRLWTTQLGGASKGADHGTQTFQLGEPQGLGLCPQDKPSSSQSHLIQESGSQWPTGRDPELQACTGVCGPQQISWGLLSLEDHMALR